MQQKRKRRTKAEIARAKARATSSRKQRLRVTHRMTLEQYEAILEFQGGRCALCRLPGVRKFLAVDHDHVVAKESCSHPHQESCENCWRGLVHGSCNSILARARDSIEFFERCISYLKDPPAQQWRRDAKAN